MANNIKEVDIEKLNLFEDKINKNKFDESNVIGGGEGREEAIELSEDPIFIQDRSKPSIIYTKDADVTIRQYTDLDMEKDEMHKNKKEEEKNSAAAIVIVIMLGSVLYYGPVTTFLIILTIAYIAHTYMKLDVVNIITGAITNTLWPLVKELTSQWIKRQK